jgi:hypothetical protein
MYRPIIIDNKGWLSETSGPIRVGAATKPYHAVTLAQAKKLLENSGSYSGRSPFASDSLGFIGDSVTGFCLTEIGWFEQLDYVYAGRIRNSMSLTANVVMPLVVFVLQDTITIKDDTIGFTLSDNVGYEDLDYVYRGDIVETPLPLSDRAVDVSAKMFASDTMILSHAPTLYTLGDTGQTDGNLDYVYTGTGVDYLYQQDAAIVPPLKIIAREPINAVEVYAPYTLGDVAETDGNLDYVYTGSGVDSMVNTNGAVIPAKLIVQEPIAVVEIWSPYTLGDVTETDGNLCYYEGKHIERMVVTESYFSPEHIQITDTLTLTPLDDGDLIYAAFPFDDGEEQYPQDGLVVQKTKPKPTGEIKTMSDGAYGYVEPADIT